MSYPLGVVTRTITVGDSITVESGTDLTVRATLRSSRGLVWIATGERAVSAPEVRESAAAGEALAFTPPVTDQAGWRDLASGALIDVSTPNAHTHTYSITLVTLRGTRQIDRRVIGPFPPPLVRWRGPLVSLPWDQHTQAASRRPSSHTRAGCGAARSRTSRTLAGCRPLPPTPCGRTSAPPESSNLRR